MKQKSSHPPVEVPPAEGVLQFKRSNDSNEEPTDRYSFLELSLATPYFSSELESLQVSEIPGWGTRWSVEIHSMDLAKDGM